MGFKTPWGESQQVTAIAPGIVSVSTAGHGGFRVAKSVWSTWPRCLWPDSPYNFVTREGNGWYEEDVGVCFVILARPDLFKPEDIEHAKKSLANSSCYKDRLDEWLTLQGGTNAVL
jgi:hypothetical protein